MEARIEQIPQSGQLDLTIHVSTPVNYSADAARRIVGRFVANEISYLLRAGDPSTDLVARAGCPCAAAAW